MAGEVALEFGRMRLVLRARAKDDAALLDTALVLGGTSLRKSWLGQERGKAPPHGCSADQAVELEVVTPTGDIVRVKEAEVFC